MKKLPRLRDKEKTFTRTTTTNSSAEWEINKEEHEVIVEDEDVAKWSLRQTGIPLNRLTEGETQKVLKMEEILREQYHWSRRCYQDCMPCDSS